MSATPEQLADALNAILAKCAGPTPGRPEYLDAVEPEWLDTVPDSLRKLLEARIARPDQTDKVDFAVAVALTIFGARVFRELLRVAGLCYAHKEGVVVDLDRNRHDCAYADMIVSSLLDECIATQIVPTTIVDLLGRLSNALAETMGGKRASLFNFDVPEARGNTSAADGRLAAALEIVLRGGMKLADAKLWLGTEMQLAGLVDAGGNAIDPERVAQWRHNFEQGAGAPEAKMVYNSTSIWLRTAPPNDEKSESCRLFAQDLIRRTATYANRTIPEPQRRDPRRRS